MAAKPSAVAEQTPEDMVLYDVIDPHVVRITLNRPHRRNAMLTPDMNVELIRKIRMAEDDDDVKVIVLAGAGEDFCSGEDIARVPLETFGPKPSAAGEPSSAGATAEAPRKKRLPQSPRIHGIQALQDMSWALLKCDKTVIAVGPGRCTRPRLQPGLVLRSHRCRR